MEVEARERAPGARAELVRLTGGRSTIPIA